MEKGIFFLIILWLTIVGSSFWWNLTDEKKENEQLAFETARAFFLQMVATRSWNAGYGGVYVPVTNDVQPNPYLEDPLRDLSTDKDIKLTKINPAYMTRQISEIAVHNEYSVQFHITSLKPIRPENEATEWEKKWLKSFEQGKKEAGGFFSDGSGSFFRYMAPLLVEDNCLKCHAKQGYKKGDIRGGISIILPHFSEETNNVLLAGYGIAATLGVIFILIGGMLLEKKQLLLSQSNQSLKVEIAERKQAGEDLHASLLEKEVLLREVYHRTKNNMAVIMSLLTLQSASITDDHVLQMFKETKNRIRAMSMVHEKLYQAQDLSNINLKAYIKELAEYLLINYEIIRDRLSLVLDGEDILVSIDTAIPCGLIINELVSNSIKHAFPNSSEGEIIISLRRVNKKEIELRIGDNGVGLPADLDIRNTDSLGFQIVMNLAETQLKGTIALNRNPTTEFQIRFKNC